MGRCCEFSDMGILASRTWLKIDQGRQNEAAVMDQTADQSEGTPLKHWYVFGKDINWTRRHPLVAGT